jgi:hypothetical protein
MQYVVRFAQIVATRAVLFQRMVSAAATHHRTGFVRNVICGLNVRFLLLLIIHGTFLRIKVTLVLP